MEYLRARLAAAVRRADVAGAGGGRARRAARGALARRVDGDRPPRRQAREPPRHRGRRGQDRRLRDRQGAAAGRDRGDAHAGRGDRRHAGLHGARAGDGAGDRAVDGPLPDGRRRLRAAHRRGSVPLRRRAAGGDDAAHQRPGAAAAGRDRPCAGCVGAAHGRQGPGRPAARAPSAAWDELEEIVSALAGPLWRRDARLGEPEPTAEQPRPLTPAPSRGASRRGRPPPGATTATPGDHTARRP